LDETANLVEKTGRRIVAEPPDVRDFTRLQSVLANAITELGRVDFVLANAGLALGGPYLLKLRRRHTTHRKWNALHTSSIRS
jgi:NADP-dependent 3-hydroxy acid dehydrogenase YdfG